MGVAWKRREITVNWPRFTTNRGRFIMNWGPITANRGRFTVNWTQITANRSQFVMNWTPITVNWGRFTVNRTPLAWARYRPAGTGYGQIVSPARWNVSKLGVLPGSASS